MISFKIRGYNFRLFPKIERCQGQLQAIVSQVLISPGVSQVTNPAMQLPYYTVLSCERGRVRRFLLQVSRHETREVPCTAMLTSRLVIRDVKVADNPQNEKIWKCYIPPEPHHSALHTELYMSCNSSLSWQKHAAAYVFLCRSHAEYNVTCQIRFVPCNRCTVFLIFYVTSIMSMFQ
jgi:hypothetical protein